jgi:hypothetical protein
MYIAKTTPAQVRDIEVSELVNMIHGNGRKEWGKNANWSRGLFSMSLLGLTVASFAHFFA